jgi:hypothetical protein
MQSNLRLFFIPILALAALAALVGQLRSAAPQSGDELALGYGFNVATWDIARIESLGFNWIKVFNPPGSRLPLNVLLRVDAQAGHLGDLPGFGAAMFHLAQSQAGYVDAYEIGNEPNLDASYGWAAPPDAAAYATLLCTAYSQIKAADPVAKVISAGLAPTGRVTGNWNGHPGHNGRYQDEREFLREFLAAGGADCLDGLGYHPYGFRAAYDAAPDLPSTDPEQNCVNGFCFRGAEKIYQIMQQEGYGHKPMWATEFGWIVQPPAHCLNDGSWDGRLWQIVDEPTQATNLVGAFQYAAAHWPWMEAMFVFNLNFNTVGWYQECEQMRYYGVQDRPAEAALRDMPKAVIPVYPQAALWPVALAAVITPDAQPFSTTWNVQLANVGTLPFTFTLQIDPTASLLPDVTPVGGALGPGGSVEVLVTIASEERPSGVYQGTITFDATPGTIGQPRDIPVTLFIFEEIHRSYLPLVQR